jgi:hypothetical protein
VVIHRRKPAQAACGQIVQNAFEFRRRVSAGDELIHFIKRKPQLGQLPGAFVRRCPLQFVDDLEELIFALPVSSGVRPLPSAFVELVPRIAAAQSNAEVLRGQTEGPQCVDQQRDQLGIRRRIGFADDVGVELEVLAQAPLLLAFVAKQLRNGEPLDRLFVVPFMRRDHSGQARRHLRPESNLPVAFVPEVIKLPDNLAAALGGEQLQRLHRRAVIFAEPVSSRRLPPFGEDVLSGVRAPDIGLRKRFRIKITKAGQTFHKSPPNVKAGREKEKWNKRRGFFPWKNPEGTGLPGEGSCPSIPRRRKFHSPRAVTTARALLGSGASS